MAENRHEASKNLPKRLRQFRDLKGWSQGQLAKKTGIYVKQISKYERGTSFPTVEVLIKLSMAFRVTLDDLVFDEKRIGRNELDDPELIKRFDQIKNLEERSQEALLTVMDALIMQHTLKELTQKIDVAS